MTNSDERNTTLKNKMKCGFGKCRRYNVGKTDIRKDVPVFTVAE